MVSLLISLSGSVFAQSATLLPNTSEFNNDSGDESVQAIKATMTNTNSGKFSAAIRALNYGTNSNGVAIWASHFGAGTAIRAASDKGLGILTYSVDGVGIYAESQNQTAANFTNSILTNTYDVVTIDSKALGPGLSINATNANSGASAMNIYHLGTGFGMNVESNSIAIRAISTASHGAALLGDNTLGAGIMGRNLSVGTSSAAVIGKNESSGVGVNGFSTGSGIGVLGRAGVDNSTGIAGKFQNENDENASNALEAVTNGTGAATFIKNTNTLGKGAGLIVGKSKPYAQAFTTNANADLEVRHPMSNTDGMSGLRLVNTGPNLSNWTLYAANGNGDLLLYADGVNKGSFNANTGAYTPISDKRLKTNIKDYTATLADVMKMEVKSYQRLNSNKTEIGLMAQDALKYFPEIVYDNTNDKGEQFYTMDYSRIGVIAIKAVQEQQSLITKQQSIIEEQQKQLQKHEAAIEMLTNELNKLTKK